MASLEEWAVNRWLVPHRASDDELTSLRAIVDRELQDASVTQISLDARLGMLYNAGLKLADIALRAHGYRAGRERQHERTVGSLVLTVGESWRATMQVIDQVRILRHRADYESVGIATEAEVRDLRAEVEALIPAIETVVAAKGYRMLPRGTSS